MEEFTVGSSELLGENWMPMARGRFTLKTKICT
jgi:hypothetical protein